MRIKAPAIATLLNVTLVENMRNWLRTPTLWIMVLSCRNVSCRKRLIAGTSAFRGVVYGTQKKGTLDNYPSLPLERVRRARTWYLLSVPLRIKGWYRVLLTIYINEERTDKARLLHAAIYG